MGFIIGFIIGNITGIALMALVIGGTEPETTEGEEEEEE